MTTIKFNENKVRLWRGVGKTGSVNIGVKFNKDMNTKEIDEIYKIVQSLLELKYGERSPRKGLRRIE